VRPTVTEQLQGAARVLREVVAPHVTDANAAEQLGHAAVALDALAAGWDRYAATVLTDLHELEALLAALDPAFVPGPALPDPALLPTVVELDERHTARRAELSVLIERLHGAPTDGTSDRADALTAVRAQLLRSADRFA
jgi:hypothetical protein